MGSDVDLMAFLHEHGDQQFCRACLAFAFEVSLPAVDSTLAVVGQQTALAEFPGQCAICGRLAFVTGLERRSARPPEDRVLQLVLDQVGRFLCPACIARRLGLNIGTAQKAVWQLRGLSGVRIDGPACSECGRRGLVVGPGRQESFAKTAGRARHVLETKREPRSDPYAKAIVEHITTAFAEDAICTWCLAGHAGVPIEDVREQVQRVSSHIRITTKPGNCPECGRRDTLFSLGGGQ